jgi:hypothetical protein
MRIAISLIASTLLASACCGGLQSSVARPSPPEYRLCEALAAARDDSRTTVSVRGIFVAGGERQILYDPDQRICDVDVQPITAIEFAPPFSPDPQFKRILERDGRAYVTFRGDLLGPRATKPDMPAFPPIAAYANRVADRRYGHLSAFRTKLVVSEVAAFSAVPSDVPAYGDSEPAVVAPAFPLVITAELPRYPEFARRAGITGVVHLRVTARNGRVVDSTVISGDRLLLEGARENVATWRLADTRDWSFETSYTYVLEQRRTGADPNPRVELWLPQSVRIVAPSLDW